MFRNISSGTASGHVHQNGGFQQGDTESKLASLLHWNGNYYTNGEKETKNPNEVFF